ncbi:WecB/TagA/CpsF family glycosyltransferase [Kocuria rosea]|uniref:WecB/TagA/CpsF family glycosyltransferase n=1 Tax=Kocuria rosea TaxID=1275 RepID=UPI001304BFDC|nr:WecB/TagA/CpsF family glycosyltransferase [Kocuria rosea]
MSSKDISGPRAFSHVMGVRVDRLDMAGTVDAIKDLVSSGGPHRHLAVNAAKLVEARTDPAKADLYNGASLVSADGQAVVWASRLLGEPLPARVAGIDLMHELVGVAASEGYRIYLLGATSSVVQDVVHIVQGRGANVVGWHDGFWRRTKTDEEMADVIRASGADILFVAVPSPMKEEFIAQQLGRMSVPVSIGVGGSFDVVAGQTRRAPLLLQRLGLEWLFRLLQEPRRMFKRYFVGNSKFVFYLAAAFLKRSQA